MYSREQYQRLQAAGGHSLSLSQPFPQPPSSNLRGDRISTQASQSSSRIDELDILDQFSQPLLQRHNGDLVGIGSSFHKHLKQERAASSSNPQRRQQPPPLPPPPPQYQYPYDPQPYQFIQPPEKRHSNGGELAVLQKIMQKQMDKQNDILSQLLKQESYNKRYEQNQPPPPPPIDHHRRVEDLMKEQALQQEMHALKREIAGINYQKQQNLQRPPLYNPMGGAANPFGMGGGGGMPNSFDMNPMMNLMNNQWASPMIQPKQDDNAKPKEPLKPKIEFDNRLEEIVFSLLKERAMSNAIRDEGLDRNYSQPHRLKSLSVTQHNYPNDDRQSKQTNSDGYSFGGLTNPNINTVSTVGQQQPGRTPQARARFNKAKRLVCNFILFIRWMKEEVKNSRNKLRNYEIEEFRGDLLKATSGALQWLCEASTNGFKSILIHCKKEQDIVDAVASKLNAKEQEIRFTNHMEDCDLLLDGIIAAVPKLPDATTFFIAKKFFDKAYYSNDPPFLFEFERQRLDLDEIDGRVNGIDKYPESPEFKLLVLTFLLIKVYIPQLLFAPQFYEPLKNTKDTGLAFNQNYITIKKLTITCAIFYHACLDLLKDTVPIPQRTEVQQSGEEGAVEEKKQAAQPFVWTVIPETIVVNNNTVKITVTSKPGTEHSMLSMSVDKEQLSLFLNKKATWYKAFKEKLNNLALALREEVASSRKSYLELQRDLLQEKAKELQHFIPARLRNVKLI